MICTEKSSLTASELKKTVESVMDDRRINQLRTTWLNNVARIQGLSVEEAVRLYEKIQPFGKPKLNR